MKTVVMKPYLSYLPADNNNEIRNSFIGEFMNELKKIKSQAGQRWILI
jgi:hypothetical protein